MVHVAFFHHAVPSFTEALGSAQLPIVARFVAYDRLAYGALPVRSLAALFDVQGCVGLVLSIIVDFEVV